MQTDLRKSKKLYFFLWVLCLLGSWSVIPYVQYLGIIPSSTALVTTFIVCTLQVLVLYGLVCYLIYKLLPKTDLYPFSFDGSVLKLIAPGLISGVLLGLILYCLNKTVFSVSVLNQGDVFPPLWIGVLASVYGGINEEVLLRLFLFTLIYFSFCKMIRCTNKNRIGILWATNIVVAIIFGMGHLPTGYALIIPSFFEIFRIMLLNGIPGLVFGWLYWSRGLYVAMISHFIADITVHVVLR